MDQTTHQMESFGALLRQYPQSSRFYDSCTPQQRQAILDQLSHLTSHAQNQGFVEHLPSAAL